MSLQKIEIKNVSLSDVYIHQENGQQIVALNLSSEEKRAMDEHILQYFDQTLGIKLQETMCVPSKGMSMDGPQVLASSIVREGKLSCEYLHADSSPFDRIWIRGLFYITIEAPVSFIQPQVFCNYTIVKIGAGDCIPRFVGDEVFPDWLNLEKYNITYEQLNEFMRQY
jgi:hypothetical protein